MAAPSAWVARQPKFSTKKVPTGVIITSALSAPVGCRGDWRSGNYAENNKDCAARQKNRLHRLQRIGWGL